MVLFTVYNDTAADASSRAGTHLFFAEFLLPGKNAIMLPGFLLPPTFVR